MLKADSAFLKNQESLFNIRKQEILNTKDCLNIQGTTYYVSNDGDDTNDGRSPEAPWKTLNRGNMLSLSSRLHHPEIQDAHYSCSSYF